MAKFAFAVVLLLTAAGQAVAQPVPEGLPAPNEFGPYPKCRANLDDKGLPMLQPYAGDPRVYGGIYLAVEQKFAPLASYFFPVLQADDHRDWVRITRVTRNGTKPPDHLMIFGNNQNLRGNCCTVPMILKIDKCTGAVLEMSFDKEKVR
jgi:hypothetical protein